MQWKDRYCLLSILIFRLTEMIILRIQTPRSILAWHLIFSGKNFGPTNRVSFWFER